MKAIGKTGIVAIMIAGAVLLFGGTCAATYSKLVQLDEVSDAQWTEVEHAYQQRAELIPDLVGTGATTVERAAILAVIEARAKVGQVAAPSVERLEQYQQAQDQLGTALSRLPVTGDLQARLVATEARIAIERMRFNEAVRTFNTARARFPTSLVAAGFGRFAEKPYFLH